MKTIETKAYAKINLYLAVTGQEDNGYHTVETVMQAISLYDIVTVSLDPNAVPSITLTCSDTSLPCDARNLAWRAVRAFFDTWGQRPTDTVHVHIEKNIPIAGGLAGGSTDAAAVLTALNTLYGAPLSKDALLSSAAQLGADVPFCVLAGLGTYTALGLHYGEQMTPCPPMPPMRAVIASMGESVSTPWAYGLMDTFPPDAAGGFRPLYDALNAQSIADIFAQMYNCFEKAVLPARPLAAACKETLLCHGADVAMMSGSGPTVIGLFSDAAKADAACAALTASGANAWICETK